jgi:hypothetical protein
MSRTGFKEGKVMDDITKVLLAIVTVAMVSVVVVNGTGTANVVKAAGSAFTGGLSAAEKG